MSNDANLGAPRPRYMSSRKSSTCWFTWCRTATASSARTISSLSVWGGRSVSDSTLTSRINAARNAVGDSGAEKKLIRTIARKGLRFVGEVRTQPTGTEPADAGGLPPDQVHEGSRAALPLPDRPAIAVLPFINMSGDSEQEYFSDGISEDIITALSKLRWFFVIARNSSFIYKGKAVHMKQIAEELGVGYVVEGSVRKGGDRVRITAQLNDAATGSHIWAEHYDRSLADVFAVQDEITEAIVAAIEPQLYAAENFRAKRKPPDSMDAWDLVMRALSHYWRVTRQDNVVAQALLEKATAIDPSYGQAHGVLATSHTFSAHMGWEDMATATPVAERAALAAILADSEDPWAHHALGCVYLFTRRFDDSLAEFELALRLNPNFSLAQGYYGLALSYSGRWEEADVAARRALRLSPRDPFSVGPKDHCTGPRNVVTGLCLALPAYICLRKEVRHLLELRAAKRLSCWQDRFFISTLLYMPRDP